MGIDNGYKDMSDEQFIDWIITYVGNGLKLPEGSEDRLKELGIYELLMYPEELT